MEIWQQLAEDYVFLGRILECEIGTALRAARACKNRSNDFGQY